MKYLPVLTRQTRHAQTVYQGIPSGLKAACSCFYTLCSNIKKIPQKKDEKDHSEALKKVISYVKEHSSQPITIHDVASLTDYSDSHFMRLFKAETGRTFISFLNEYRLQVSAYMLKETKDPVSLVAVKAGFENLSYFIRMFTKTYGVPPGRYRKNFMQQASW